MSFRSLPTRREIENSKKKSQKNWKNWKNPLWFHFKPKQVGKGWKREKIKIIVSFRSYPTHNRKFQKNSKKIQKIKQYHYGSISSQKRLEKASREKIKIIVPFCSYLTCNRKFQKNSKKIQKIKQDHYGSISSQNRLKEDEKGRK